MNQRIATTKIAVLALLTITSWVSNRVMAAEEPAKRPNFVWLMSEDNSVHYLDLYCETGAPTPNIRRLAEDGVVFNHAFSVAPVCSAARSMLATGCYGSRIGTQYHRRAKFVPLPDNVKPVFAVMREAGYYTTNKGKTDYNFSWKGPGWHGSGDWRDRKREPGQPFFHKQTFVGTHEGRLQRANRGGVKDEEFVAPCHPDTPLFRQAHRAYNDLITAMDGQVGEVVDKLKKDGLLEDTFIFYFGDHGGVLPGSKGYVYETGLHVPLVVRIPENFKHLVDLKRGTRTDGFVEFVDFGATIMRLAGITPPEGIDGTPFMGPGISKADLEARDEAFGMADRFDEKYDLVRSLRKGNLKYIRNYQPFNFDGLQNNYRYRMGAYKEWRGLYEAGKLNAAQAQFFETREPEALYDVVNDPYETVNLANDPAYAKQLQQLRNRLAERMKAMPDLSLYPESYLIEEAFGDPVGFGQAHQEEIAELVDVADLALLPFSEAKVGISATLASDNPWKRYWGLIVCSCFGKQAEAFVKDARQLAAEDENLLVRTRAVEFLGLIGAQDPGPLLNDILSKSQSEMEVVLILNTAVLLQDGQPGYDIEIDPAMIHVNMRRGSLPWSRVQYLKKK